MTQALGPASRSLDRALRLTAFLAGVVWVPLTLFYMSTTQALNHSALTVCCEVLFVVGAILTLSARVPAYVPVALTAIASLSLTLMLSDSAVVGSREVTLGTGVYAAIAIASIRLSGLWGVVSIAAIATCAITIEFISLPSDTQTSFIERVDAGMIASALGAVVFLLLVDQLRDSASKQDSHFASALESKRETDRARAAEEGLQAFIRDVHDKMANTFGAISLGFSGSSTAIRQRCTADLDFLRQPPSVAVVHHDAVDFIVTSAGVKASQLEMHLAVESTRGQLTPPPPQSVVTAITGAVDEALINLSKHAQTGARIHVGVAGDALTVLILGDTASADVSAGFLSPGASIVGRCRDMGVNVRLVELDRRRGVELSWRADGDKKDLRDRVGWAAPWVALSSVPVVTLWWAFALYAAAFVVIIAHESPQLSASGLGYAIAAVVVFFFGWAPVLAKRQRDQRRSVVVVRAWTFGCAFVGMGLAALSVATCQQLIVSSLLVHMGLATMFVSAAALGRAGTVFVAWLGYVVCLSAAMRFTFIDNVQCSTQLGFGLTRYLVVYAVFWMILAALLPRFQRGLVDAELADRAALHRLAREQDRARSYRQLLPRLEAVSGPLLAGIADGTIDPSSDKVREQAREAEYRMRSVINAARREDYGSGLELELLTVAWERPVRLRVRGVLDGEVDAAEVARASAAFRELSMAMAPDTSITMTLVCGQDGRSMRAVCDGPVATPVDGWLPLSTSTSAQTTLMFEMGTPQTTTHKPPTGT